MERRSQSILDDMQLATSARAPAHLLSDAISRVGSVVRGKEDVVRLALVGFFARGHVLLEDVPGVGKTTLARSLAQVLGGSFSRVQLTADLLPADIVGGQVIDKASGGLVFRPGPIFANVVLADELNRATPRTQSGLLEAMSERSISVDGVTHALPDPFLVIATQNPIEHHGVYALPQSQMDRFIVRTHLGYPDDDTERALLLSASSGVEAHDRTPERLETLFDPADLTRIFEAVEAVRLGEEVAGYIQRIASATRSSPRLATGVSTRGAIQFARAARALALVSGRAYVTPDDVYQLCVPVTAHRVVPRGQDRTSREAAEAIIREIVDGVPAPL